MSAYEPFSRQQLLIFQLEPFANKARPILEYSVPSSPLPGAGSYLAPRHPPALVYCASDKPSPPLRLLVLEIQRAAGTGQGYRRTINPACETVAPYPSYSTYRSLFLVTVRRLLEMKVKKFK